MNNGIDIGDRPGKSLSRREVADDPLDAAERTGAAEDADGVSPGSEMRAPSLPVPPVTSTEAMLDSFSLVPEVLMGRVFLLHGIHS